MNCLKPVDCWSAGNITSADGVPSVRLVFSYREALEYWKYPGLVERHYMPRPCGKCLLCQQKKRKDMALRLTHEASLYGDQCCFITLTYDEDHIPVTCFRSLKHHKRSEKMIDRGYGELPIPTLYPRDVQLFMKRLRRHLEYLPKRPSKFVRDHVDNPIRYFCVGEYGGKTSRPHYHLIIFGWRPSDLRLFSDKGNYQVYLSDQLTKLWKYGFHTVSMVNNSVARYCARYVTKKFSRLESADTFEDSRIPEFTLQSVKNGGIGAPFFDMYGENMLLKGFTSYRHKDNIIKSAIPRYYLDRGRKKFLPAWLKLRECRIDFCRKHIDSHGELLTNKAAIFKRQLLEEIQREIL